jgi:hypothetical protein
MKHDEFVIKALEMFDGQFPNEIIMRKPNFDLMDSPEHNISQELRQWIIVTLGKYKKLVK